MSRFLPRPAPLVLAISLVLGSSPLLAETRAGGLPGGAPRQISIASQPLGEALNAWARQTGAQLAAPQALVAGKAAPAVSGLLTPRQALDRLLSGSGLEALVDGEAVTIRAASSAQVSDVTLAPVVVTAQVERTGISEGSRSYTSNGPSRAATGLNLTLRETPQAVTVMTQQRMEDFKLETLTDVMEQTPGVTVSRQNDMITFNVRGANVNLQTDGNRQIASGWGYNSHIAYSLDDMADIDRIEVLKGSSGLMNGDGNPGATVNLIRKRPTREFQARIGAGAGSWDTYRADADVSGPLNEDTSLRGRFVAARKEADSFRDHQSSRSTLLYGTIEQDLTPDTVLGAGITYRQREVRGAGATTPIQAYANNGDFLGLQPRSFNLGASWAGYEQDSLGLFARLEHRFANGWSGRFQLANEQVDTPEMLVGFLRYADPTRYMGNVYRDIKSRNQSITFDLSGPFELLGRQHELLIGAGASRNRTTLQRGLSYTGDYASLGLGYADGGAGIPLVDASTLKYSSDVFDRKRRYAYTAARFSVADPVKVITGVRVTDYEQDDVTDVSWYNYQMTERGVVTPYAGVVVDLSRNISVYGSYASIFEAQSAKDLNESSLPPKEGRSYEVGAKGEFFDKRLNTSLSIFWMHTSNEAEEAGLTPTGDTAYRAVSGARQRGYELELSGELARGWQAQGSYVLNSSSLESSSTSPRHQFKLGSTYRISSGLFNGLTVGAATRWQSGIATGVLEQKAYWLVDVMTRYQVDKQLSVAANVNNLFDKSYFSGVTDFTRLHYTWGAPRSFNVSVRYDFF